MSKPKCPKCKRDATYNAKYDQCSGCGLGYGKATSVTDAREMPEPHVSNVTPVTDDTGPSDLMVGPLPGEVCPQCHERKPSEAALKQREYRERKKGKEVRNG